MRNFSAEYIHSVGRSAVYIASGMDLINAAPLFSGASHISLRDVHPIFGTLQNASGAQSCLEAPACADKMRAYAMEWYDHVMCMSFRSSLSSWMAGHLFLPNKHGILPAFLLSLKLTRFDEGLTMVGAANTEPGNLEPNGGWGRLEARGVSASTPGARGQPWHIDYTSHMLTKHDVIRLVVKFDQVLEKALLAYGDLGDYRQSMFNTSDPRMRNKVLVSQMDPGSAALDHTPNRTHDAEDNAGMVSKFEFRPPALPFTWSHGGERAEYRSLTITRTRFS